MRKRITKKMVKAVIASLESDELIRLLSATATLVGAKNTKLIDFGAITVAARDPTEDEISQAKASLLASPDMTAVAAYLVFDLLGVKINVVPVDAAAAIAASYEIGRPWRGIVERHFKCMPSEYVVVGDRIMPRLTQNTAASLKVGSGVARAAIYLGARDASV